MEDKKQELFKLIDNLDWEIMKLFQGKPTVESSTLDIIIEFFKRHQKQPTIEQQLQKLGFNEGRISECNTLAYWIPKEANSIIYLFYDVNHFEYERMICYEATFLKTDTNKILSFAKHLKELKEKENHDI